MGADTGRRVTQQEWAEEGRRRFGESIGDWKFVCPACGHVASFDDYVAAKAPQEAIGFSCVGRWTGAARDALTGKGRGPCNYAGGGLFGLNPVTVILPDGKEMKAFEFAGEVARG